MKNTKEQGSILLFITAVMAIAILMAAGMYVLSTTSLLGQPSSFLGEKAGYLAESGYRFLASEFLNATTLEEKLNRLENLNETSFYLKKDGSFTLYIYPYFYRIQRIQGRRLFLTVPGTLPQNLNLPSRGTIKIKNSFYTYRNPRKLNEHTIRIRTNRKVEENIGDIVCMVFYPSFPQTIRDGSTLTIAGDSRELSCFPDRNGLIEINGKNYFYHFKKQGSVLLTNIRREDKKPFIIHITPSTPIILKPTLKIESKGTIGFPLKISKKISYFIPITNLNLSEEGSTQTIPLSDEPGGQDTFQDLSNWNTIGSSQYVDVTTSVGTSHGKTNKAVSFVNTWPWSLIKTRYFIFLKPRSEIENYWKEHEKLLTYTAQVKIGWSENLDYSATGICFRWHKAAYDYEGYGVSFIIYNSRSNFSDGIPMGLKPPNQEKKLLIVLWKRENGNFQWIAYKNIHADVKMIGSSWVSSGILEDLSSLFVRVEEKRINGQKVNDIKIFYGDASLDPSEPHIGDKLYNNTNRLAYNPTFSKISKGKILWPLWDLSKWEQDKDFFTLVDNVPVSINPQPTPSQSYWVINPDSGASLLSDGITIRVSDFISPEGDSFYPQNELDRPEIALHCFGYLSRYWFREFVSFFDFAIALGEDSETNIQSIAFGTVY